MKPTMVEEHDSHFIMHDGESPFKVPKKDLSEALHEKIRGMARKMSEGGGTDLPLPERRGGDVGTASPILTSFPPEATPAPVGPVYAPSLITPGPAWAPPDPLADLRASGKFDEAGYAAARRGEFPKGGPEQYQTHQLRVSDVDKTMADRAKAAELGIRPKDSPATASTATKPETAIPAKPTMAPGRTAGPIPGTTDFANATEEGRAAIEAKGRAEAEQARSAANALVEGDKVLQAHALEQKRILETAHARSEDLMNRYRAAQEDMRNIDTTVDPGRFWASRTTAQKITGIIGLALGALGTGPDGINRAAQMLNTAIDRDIDAQKAEHGFRLQKGKAALDATQSMYGMNHQIFQDDLTAHAATKATAMDLINNKLQQVSATASSPIAKANAAALSAQLLAQKGKFDSDAANTAFDNTTQRITANAQATAAGAKGGGLDQKQRDALIDTNERNTNLQRNGKQLLKYIDDYGTGELMTPGIETKMKQLVADMAIDAAKIKDPSSIVRPSEAEAEAANIFQPGWLQRTASAKAKIEAFMNNNQARKETGLEVRGLR